MTAVSLTAPQKTRLFPEVPSSHFIMLFTLHLTKFQHDHLDLPDIGAKPLLPFLERFKQLNGVDSVDEPVIVPSLEALRETRLLSIVQPKPELTGEDFRVMHNKFAEEVVNELAQFMVSHKPVPVPYANDDDEARKAAQQAFDSLDATKIVRCVRTEPKSGSSWMDFISCNREHYWEFGSSFRTPRDLVADIRYIRGWIPQGTEQSKPLMALMDDLAGALDRCELIEAWLSTCLCLWWGAAQIFILREPAVEDYNKKERVAELLRNYVATVLLVESVHEGDRTAATKVVVD